MAEAAMELAGIRRVALMPDDFSVSSLYMASAMHSQSTRDSAEHNQLFQNTVGDQGRLQPCHQTHSC